MTVLPAVAVDSGMDDLTYIRRLRELLRDIPQPASEQFSGNGTGVDFQANQRPINDDDGANISVTGWPTTTIFRSIQELVGPTNCFVNFDTGQIVFAAPPPAATNNVVFRKNTVKWRDSVLLFALQSGLRRMFPKFSRLYVDTSITLATNQYDYPLPLTFLDEGVTIRSVGVQDLPSATEPFRLIHGWSRVGMNTLHIKGSQGWAPGSTLRIEYYGPYQSLGGLPPRAINLPIWYAAGMLLGFREEKRARDDTQNVAAGVTANPPGSQQNAGTFFMRQFEQELRGNATPKRGAGVVLTWNKS